MVRKSRKIGIIYDSITPGEHLECITEFSWWSEANIFLLACWCPFSQKAESKKATKKESSSSDDASDEDETVNYLLIKLI